MKGTGDCYEANANYLMDVYLADQNTPILLCHGLAIGQGPIKGIKHGHCWLEINNMVMDFSNNHTITMSKEAYYKLGKIKYVHRYNAKETAKMLLKHQHYGPWTD